MFHFYDIRIAYLCARHIFTPSRFLVLYIDKNAINETLHSIKVVYCVNLTDFTTVVKNLACLIKLLIWDVFDGSGHFFGSFKKGH